MQTKYFLSLFFLAGLVACKKEQVEMLPIQETNTSANVKIVHASAYTTNYSVQLKVNNTRISNAFTYSTPFPGGGLNTGGSNMPWYLALSPGSLNISMSVPKVGTGTDSLALFNGVTNVEANKSYSIYLSDTASKTQMSVVTENTALPQSGQTRLKFINLMPNTTGLDLYVGTNKVADNIGYKSVSPDFTLTRGDTVRFYLRIAGAAANSTPLALYPTLSPFQAPFTVPERRIMTVFARGYNNATGTRAPAVSLLYN
jgi:hypothetical protein